MREFWQKQTKSKPLFPEMEWSRPENKQFAGKLLILGGNAYGFTAPAEAYGYALQSGIGVARVLLPDTLSKTVSAVFPEAEYTLSTPSGSFSQKALNDVLQAAYWGDSVLLAGDFGRNSETAILLEKFATKYDGQLVITKDGIDYFTKNPTPIINRPNTTLVLSLAQLQQLAKSARYTTAFTFGMDLLQLIDVLHDFTQSFAVNIIVKHLDVIIVAVGGKVSTTAVPEAYKIWRLQSASGAAVWWAQNPSKPYDALSTALAA